MKKTTTSEGQKNEIFDLSKTNWEIDPSDPDILKERRAEQFGTKIAVGGCVCWTNFDGATDSEK